MNNCGRLQVRAGRLVTPALAGRADIQLHKASSTSQISSKSSPGSDYTKAKPEHKVEDVKKTHKTVAQIDEEMRQAMEGIAGEGGEHGAELEDGKPVAMKRSVKENMFRYI